MLLEKMNLENFKEIYPDNETLKNNDKQNDRKKVVARRNLNMHIKSTPKKNNLTNGSPALYTPRRPNK